MGSISPRQVVLGCVREQSEPGCNPTKKCKKAPFSLHLHPHGSVIFLILAILNGEKRNIKVVLICISLTVTDVNALKDIS